ncbi:MAG: inositol monophosphatase [Actinobacteria bacterium]|nr:inositol monophosphatase [Actinomycetota bacterium]
MLTHERDFARTLARQAGAIMLEHFRTGVAHRSKGDGSPVTAADEAINQLMLESVNRTYPGDGVIGEEGSSPATSSGRIWVCDPIDGTIPFTFGIPTNMFSLALVDDGLPVLGVLYDPYLDRLYEAAQGEGASVNGQPISVSDAPLSGAFIALHGAQFGLLDNAAVMSDAITQGMRVLALGSIVYESALVATGQITACVFGGQSVWDLAAVKVIVEEAGGVVTDLHGEPQRYDGSVTGGLISNRMAHTALADFMRTHVAGLGAG